MSIEKMGKKSPNFSIDTLKMFMQHRVLMKAKTITKFREKLNITQHKAAFLSGIPRWKLQLLESGVKEPTPQEQEALKNIFLAAMDISQEQINLLRVSLLAQVRNAGAR